jgi:hypothetical protein
VNFRRFSIHLLNRFNPNKDTPAEGEARHACPSPDAGVWLESEGVQDQGAGPPLYGNDPPDNFRQAALYADHI